MASEPTSSRRNQTPPRGPLLTVYLALLSVVAAWFLIQWGTTLVSILSNFQSGFADLLELEQFDLVVSTGGLIVVGLVLLVFLRAIFNLWRMRRDAYNNVLVFSGAAVLYAWLVMENWPIALGLLAQLIVLMALAHTRFYPEYKGKTPYELTRNLSVIRLIAQIIFAVLVAIALKTLVANVYSTLGANNALPTFEFLFRRAGFQINQSPDWYSSNSRYLDAFFVGAMNTLQVVSLGLVLATILGVLLGIFLLTDNWLIKTISRVYVEILRNTPLLVQLIFWYFVVWLNLPENDILLPGESVMVVALRFFPYLVIILANALYVWRFNAPPGFFNGILTGFLLVEGAFMLLGDNYVVIGVLALAGAAVLYADRSTDLIPSGRSGFANGIGVFAVAQFAGHLALDGLSATGVLERSRAVFGEVLPAFVISRSGFVMPELIATPNLQTFLIVLVIGLAVAFGLNRYLQGIVDRTGRNIPATFSALLVAAAFAVGGWMLASQPIDPQQQVTVGEAEELQTLTLEEAREQELLSDAQLVQYSSEDPLVVRIPERNRFGRVEVGVEISPSYMALLIGLVIYTSAFIGEIVRAGIQAVPFGQIEASRALGLNTSQTLRMIVLPQALRVIIPPMGNQYLNLAKNSSLAAAIAYADTYQVGTTIMNQSGQSVTGFFIVLIVYLTMSLVISLVMNLVNSRFQLVTR